MMLQRCTCWRMPWLRPMIWRRRAGSEDIRAADSSMSAVSSTACLIVGLFKTFTRGVGSLVLGRVGLGWEFGFGCGLLPEWWRCGFWCWWGSGVSWRACCPCGLGLAPPEGPPKGCTTVGWSEGAGGGAGRAAAGEGGW
jgi:hypothetical protein